MGQPLMPPLCDHYNYRVVEMGPIVALGPLLQRSIIVVREQRKESIVHVTGALLPRPLQDNGAHGRGSRWCVPWSQELCL
jgi:hypothetical protein